MKKEKSLIIFIPSIENAGVERNLYLIANFLSKKKISIEVLTAFKKEKKFFNRKIKVISLEKNSKIKSRFFKTIITIFLFIKYCKNKDSLILSFQANTIAILLGMIFKKNVIIRSNTSPEKYINNPIKKILFKTIFKFANEIIVNSYEFKQRFKKFFSITPTVIYNPFLARKTGKINFNFLQDKKSLKIINVARLTDQKDHLTLLIAIKKLCKVIKCKLLIVGTGYNEKKLKDYILENELDKNVKLIGYKSNPEDYIKISDLFVLSSIYEGLPNVLIEAQNLKKYIISTDCPTGPKEILKKGKCGDLYKVKDYERLFKLLRNFNSKSPKVRKKILQGYKSLDRFDYKTNCKKYLKLISKYL